MKDESVMFKFCFISMLILDETKLSLDFNHVKFFMYSFGDSTKLID